MEPVWFREAEAPQGILLQPPFPLQDWNLQQKLQRSKTKKFPSYKCFWNPLQSTLLGTKMPYCV